MKSSSINRKAILLLLLIGMYIPLSAQSITTMEYWFDGDWENTRTLPVTGNAIDAAVNTDELPEGFHFLYYRLKTGNGSYSVVNSSVFIKINSPGDVTTLKYWFDDKVENKKTLPVSGNSVDNKISTEGLDVGFHTIYYVLESARGLYSAIQSLNFLKVDVSGNISSLEYWFDGNIDEITVLSVPGGDIDLALNTDELKQGAHGLHYRLKEENGSYTPVRHVTFLKLNDPADITSLEYWFDGNIDEKKTLPVKAGTLDEIIDTDNLSVGFHTINYRLKEENGSYTAVHSSTFFKIKTSGDITIVEYWIDDQSGGIKTLAVVDNSVDATIDTDGLGTGLHTIYYRLKDEKGSYSVLDAFIFLKEGEQSIAEINALEYWFDDHNSSRKMVEVHSEEIIDLQLDASTIGPGVHMLFFRLRSTTDMWSTILSYPIIKVGKYPVDNRVIEGCRYWFNSDDSKVYTAVFNNPDIEVDQLIPLRVDLPIGLHTITVQLYDNTGQWSAPISSQFEGTSIGDEKYNDIEIYFTRNSETLVVENGEGNLIIYSVDGNMIYRKDNIERFEEVRASDWITGIYIVRIESGNRLLKTVKVIK